MKTKAFPGPGQAPQEKKPLLPVPEDQPATGWTERAEKAQEAQEARALGRKLRKGKRILFSSRHHLAR